MMPGKPVSTLLFWSRAVTVKLKGVPAVVLAGAEMLKCVATIILTTKASPSPP
jgi:hypothetical protein